MTDSWRVAVLLGGTSAERDVSLASGRQVVRALRALGHQVWAVDIAQDWLDQEQEQALFAPGVSALPPALTAAGKPSGNPLHFLASARRQSVDLWFLALHGGLGEDGRIQALLDLTGIPYTGSGVLGSALAMDKDMTKRLLRLAHVPTPNWLMAPVSTQQVTQQLGWPVVVKPSKQGSTVGLSVVRRPEDLSAALALAREYDDEVMVEQFIPGRELTCPVLEVPVFQEGISSIQGSMAAMPSVEALSVGEIILQQGEIFDYAAKYQPGGAREVFPAALTFKQTQQIQTLALEAHQALKLSGYSRADFRMDASGQFWCLEINTLPGLTAMSLLPQAALAQGMSFESLIDRLCRLALQARPS